MRKLIKQKLVEILRNPETKLTRGQLKNPRSGAMCPLGIICELYRQKHPKTSKWEDDGTFQPDINNSYRSYGEVLPREVANWAKISDVTFYVKSKSGETLPIYDVNDSLRYSKEELANLIEAS